MQRVLSGLAWGISPGASGPARLRFSGRSMTLQNPGRGPGPRPAHPNLDPAASRRTNLSYSDRVRNMARTGGGGSGYAGVSKGHTTKSSTLVNHTATAPRTPQQSARAHATFLARPPVPLSYWLIDTLAATIGLTSFLTGPGLTGRAELERTSAFRHLRLLRALGLVRPVVRVNLAEV